MKNIFTRRISGIIFIVTGLLIAIGPQTVFKPCTALLELVSGRMVPMRCHWAAAAETGIGGAIAFLGLLLLFFPVGSKGSSQLRLGLSISLAVMGLVTVLLPTKLIGVCMTKTMECNLLMLPMLMVLGSAVIAAALANVFLLYKEAASAGT